MSCTQGLYEQDKEMSYFPPIFKNGKKDQWVYSFTSVPRRMMEQLILETISRYMKVKKVIRSNQHGLAKGMPCLSYPITFYDEISRRRKSIGYCLYLNFTEAFNTVSCKMLIGKLLICRLEEWTVGGLKPGSVTVPESGGRWLAVYQQCTPRVYTGSSPVQHLH